MSTFALVIELVPVSDLRMLETMARLLHVAGNFGSHTVSYTVAYDYRHTVNQSKSTRKIAMRTFAAVAKKFVVRQLKR